MSINTLDICIFTKPCAEKLHSDFAMELSDTLRKFDLNSQIINSYPSVEVSRNILLLDASFEVEAFGDIDLSFPILKILKSYPDFKKIDFHDFIVHPFSEEELVSRIIHLYNIYKNIQLFQKLTNNFKSYLLNLSHDVYSPIKLIKSQIDYLRLNSINEHHNTIFDSTISQLTNITNVLLSVPYSSIASDNIAIYDNIQNVNFADLIHSIVMQLDLYASTQGVDIKVEIQKKAKDVTIVSNYNYLWRMAYNLVINAIKYCVGGGTIKLSLSKLDNILRWELSDTGIGMTSEQLTNIRRYLVLPYKTSNESVDASSAEATGGFGRGLVVAKLVASFLNATVTIDSELGVGTTFLIDIPIVDGV